MYLGMYYFAYTVDSFFILSIVSFGLLHRIPAIPEGRQPGSIPEELLEPPDEYEEQQLFVPADVAPEPETPEETEARLRWEQEEWERETYARNYMHDSAVSAANHISSAYDDPFEIEHKSHTTNITSTGEPEQGPQPKSAVSAETSAEQTVNKSPYEIVAPTPVRSALRQDSMESTVTPTSTSRSASFSLARASTPTPTRPFGSFMNGDFK